MNAHPTVILGMSGGVDSSVAAFRLVDQGYRVQGITLKTWVDEDESVRETTRWQERGCCKVGMARYVAKILDIPHEVVDIQSIFQREVIDDFVASYLQGTTPNPCVRCNERVKLLALYQIAQDRQAKYFATGHYARIAQGHRENHVLLKGEDPRKDQSYFLYRVAPSWMRHLIFPLGQLTKEAVWRQAEDMGLPTAELQESQEICFVTQGDYRKFLVEQAPETLSPGSFVSPDGEVLGEHQGIAFYTPGQRKGLGIATGNRLYVHKVVPATHSVVLGPREGLLRDECVVSDLNVLDIAALQDGMPVEVKFRYASPSVPAQLHWRDRNNIQVQFDSPQMALSPGQSAVFYRRDQVLGGGVIQPF